MYSAQSGSLARGLNKLKTLAPVIKGRLNTGSRAPLRTSAPARAPQSPVGTDLRPQTRGGEGWRGSARRTLGGGRARGQGALQDSRPPKQPERPEPERLTFQGCGFCPSSWVGRRQQSPGPDRDHIGHNAGSCGRRDAAHPTPGVPEQPKWRLQGPQKTQPEPARRQRNATRRCLASAHAPCPAVLTSHAALRVRFVNLPLVPTVLYITGGRFCSCANICTGRTAQNKE